MKIVRLWGGLGNQMYQYAFAKGLEKHYKTPVLFDVTILTTGKDKAEHDPVRNPQRKLDLTHFPNIRLLIANKRQINCALGGSYSILSKGKRAINRWFGWHIPVPDERDFWITDIFEEKKRIDEDGWPLGTGKTYYAGYWQKLCYFSCIEDELRIDFQFPVIKDDFNCGIARRIADCECPVCLHVRRGDYLNTNWELQVDYYRKALAYIQSHLANPTFFVFGQHCENFIAEELHINAPVVVVGEENSHNHQDFRDMQLMSLCRHHIIANSSFSWWAAWLAKQDEQIVVYPSPWIEGQEHDCPTGWVKIIWK